jgi:hypothetical protein
MGWAPINLCGDHVGHNRFRVVGVYGPDLRGVPKRFYKDIIMVVAYMPVS